MENHHQDKSSSTKSGSVVRMTKSQFIRYLGRKNKNEDN